MMISVYLKIILIINFGVILDLCLILGISEDSGSKDIFFNWLESLEIIESR